MSFPINQRASATVYRVGTTYKALLIDGKAYKHDTDASNVIQAAIDNMPGAAARGYAGKISILAGDYQCKTTITAFDETLTYNSVDLEGEGKGTRLNFTPSSALTNGIVWRNDNGRIGNMLIYANQNVTNVIRLQGQTVGPSQNSYCILENLYIAGHDWPAGGSAVPIAGQVGILIDGSIPAVYFTKIVNVDLHVFDIGLDAFGVHGHATMQSNVVLHYCNTGIKLRNGQHNLSNIWCQGTSTVGKYGIHLALDTPNSDEGSQCLITNVNAEMQLTTAETAAVLIDTGVPNVRTSNIRNSEDIKRYQYAILDKNVRAVNQHLDRYLATTAHRNNRRGWWDFGMQAYGHEGGYLAGCVQESPASTFTTLDTANGAAKSITTTSTINNIASIFYNKSHGYGAFLNTSNLKREHAPRFSCSFVPVDPTVTRFFIGLWDQFAAPTSTSDILNARKGFGLWIDTGVSNNYKMMHNDGSGASTITQIGAGIPVASNFVRMEIITDHANSTFTLNLVGDAFAWTSTTATTDIPDNTGNLGFLISVETLAAATRRLWLYNLDLETSNA